MVEKCSIYFALYLVVLLANSSFYGYLVLKMKFFLLFLFALCISKAATYGLYGCYERLMYWQAYQMDSDSYKKRVAPACSRDPIVASKIGPIRGGRCNLRQFLYYISKDNNEKAIIADKNKLRDADLARERTEIDYVASKLHGANIGKSYNGGHIYEGLKSHAEVDQIIKTIAG